MESPNVTLAIMYFMEVKLNSICGGDNATSSQNHALGFLKLLK